MKFLIIFAFVLTFVYYTSGETFTMDGSDPAYPGMCVYEGEPYPVGEHKVKKRCIKIICSANGWISGASCIPQQTTGCKPGELLRIKDPFPDCCKRKYYCEDDVEGKYILIDF